MKKIIVKTTDLPRLDKYLATCLTEDSREKIKQMILKGYILVNDQVTKANYKVKCDDVIKVEEMEKEDLEILPYDIPLNIVYEDDDLLVINKPSGLVVHPSIGHTNDTLVNGLMYHIKNLSSINGVVRPGIVHRIDKDTSGLLVVAKNDYAHNFLASQLSDKTLSRNYLALVYGVIPHDLGKIAAPIGRDPKDRKKMACVKDGKPAVTHFKVLERFAKYTLIECKLETGRTHQIRVHMAYIGYPICGDPIYGRKKVIGQNGQFLHAYKIGFIHPRTKEYMEFTCEAEKDFQEALENLRNDQEIM